MTGVSSQNAAAFDQAEVIAFLSDPSAYGDDSVEIERIDTHASVVFLAGAQVFKLKRAVRYPFLDYSTLELRRRYCEREVAINRRTAPNLYLGVAPVVVDQNGNLAISGAGTPVEYLVAMRRFDGAGLFSQLADDGNLDSNLIGDAVDQVIALHDSAEVAMPGTVSGGGAAGLHNVIADNAVELIAHAGLFGRETVETYNAAVEDALSCAADLLDQRAKTGFVRHCHGDLHLANICMFEGQPTLFDAIEFSDTIARIDTLYDFAFLLMDLDVRGLTRHANRAFNHYMAHNKDGVATIVGLASLPLFMSVRAAVRAVVSALTADRSAASSEEARAARAAAIGYLTAAQRYLEPSEPILLAIGGASGTGKSAVAAALAPEIGVPPGALVLRTDEIRKQLAGLRDHEHLPSSAYTPEHHDAVYAEMRARAEAALAAGRSCILDAVHGRPNERAQAQQLAERHQTAFAGIWLEAPAERLLERVATRHNDASDAGVDVVRQQLAAGFGEIGWPHIDASRPLRQVVRTIRSRIQHLN